MKLRLQTIVGYADQLLNHAGILDFSGAFNGLQIENGGQVSRIAAAVDANWLTLQAAVEARADFLIVHHGLFWQGVERITDSYHRKVKWALDHNLAVYSSHLPLDAHPKLGNNILLAKQIGLIRSRPFFEEKGTLIGRKAHMRIGRVELSKRLESALGRNPHLIAAGPETCQQIGLVTGGAGNELARAASEGIDTFITGEGNHWTFGLAHDLGINVFYGGHYLTETFGVKALAAHLSKKYKLPWNFLDYPSGL